VLATCGAFSQVKGKEGSLSVHIVHDGSETYQMLSHHANWADVYSFKAADRVSAALNKSQPLDVGLAAEGQRPKACISTFA
jgi:hypothetical protein